MARPSQQPLCCSLATWATAVAALSAMASQFWSAGWAAQRAKASCTAQEREGRATEGGVQGRAKSSACMRSGTARKLPAAAAAAAAQAKSSEAEQRGAAGNMRPVHVAAGAAGPIYSVRSAVSSPALAVAVEVCTEAKERPIDSHTSSWRPVWIGRAASAAGAAAAASRSMQRQSWDGGGTMVLGATRGRLGRLVGVRCLEWLSWQRGKVAQRAVALCRAPRPDETR